MNCMVDTRLAARAYSNIKDGQGIQVVLKKYIIFHMAGGLLGVIFKLVLCFKGSCSGSMVSAWSH